MGNDEQLGRDLGRDGCSIRPVTMHRSCTSSAVPASGSTLQLREVVRMESHGQGIAIDRATGLLYSIQRRTREVLVSELPAIQ